jgi:hypothetical protein
MTVCALCGETAPLIAPLHYCANCVAWLHTEHGPILLDPPVLLNCAGLPDPVLIDRTDARERGLTCRPNQDEVAYLQSKPLHPSLTEPARMEALTRARERDLTAWLATVRGAA